MSKPLLVMGNKNYSSWSLRAWLALRKAGVGFDERLLPLDTPEFYAQIEQLSPAARVPVMHYDDCCVWDSLAIVETVNERWAQGSLLPASPQQRALARSVSAEMHTGFEQLRELMPMNSRALGRQVAPTPALKKDIARVIQIWCDCRELAKGDGGWLFGDFSMADAMFAPVVLRFNTYGVALDGDASQYCQFVLRDPDVKEWMTAAEEETEVVSAGEVGV